jgi:peroxiredoxin
VWAISPDPTDKLAQYAAKEGIGFALLSDPDLAAINAWGLANSTNPKVPHPTAVIVDSDGTIRYLRQDVDYKQRPSSEELLAALVSAE